MEGSGEIFYQIESPCTGRPGQQWEENRGRGANNSEQQEDQVGRLIDFQGIEGIYKAEGQAFEMLGVEPCSGDNMTLGDYYFHNGDHRTGHIRWTDHMDIQISQDDNRSKTLNLL